MWTPKLLKRGQTANQSLTFNFLYQSNISDFFAPMFRVTLGARGFFPVVCGKNWATKPWSSRSLLRRSMFAANNKKKTLLHPGYFRVRGTDQKIQKCRKARTLPWSARDFSSAVSGFCQVKASPLVASAYGRRCVDLRPTPKIPENSRRTREKPLVPRVRERLLFVQTKGGKMLQVAYRDWQEHFMCLNLTNQLLPRH